MAKWWQWALGGAALVGIVAAASSASAAPPPRRRAARGTTDEDLFGDALRRLGNFINAAKIDAKAYKLESNTGSMILGVQPGARFVMEDSLALPKVIDGIDVVIKGWPR